MSYWDEKEYWADASTRNCVWLFQISEKVRNCGCDTEEECEHVSLRYYTANVFLTRQEAKDWGTSRPYEWGKENEGWRVYGVPCCGLMAELISRHLPEIKDKVDYIFVKKEEDMTKITTDLSKIRLALKARIRG